MTVKVNLDDCIGCGVCSQICPEVFEMDEDAGKIKVVHPEGSECTQEAIDSCPVSCILEEA